MSNEQLDIDTVIIVVVVAIIGTILLWVGVKKKKRVLRFCGIGFFIGAGVSLFVKSTELREILTAMAAVFAVIIAAFSIDESRRLRQDSIDRERRDRRERLLNEIIEWAKETIQWDMDTSYEARKELKEAENPLSVIFLQLIRLSGGFNGIEKEGRHYIHKLVCAFKHESLQNDVDKLLEDLQTHNKLIGFQLMTIKDTKLSIFPPGFDDAETKVHEHKKRLNESAEKVIEEAAKLKAKDVS